MAKRFTDTNLIKQKWYYDLSLKMRCAWHVLLADCDHAGLWCINMEYMKYILKEDISLKEMITELTRDDENRVVDLGNGKIFIPGFIKFQYKCNTLDELKESNPVHESVLQLLEKNGVYKPLGSPLAGAMPTPMAGAKDKAKDEDMDTVKDKIKNMDMDKDWKKIRELLDAQGIPF